jgi:hypothetical protein
VVVGAGALAAAPSLGAQADAPARSTASTLGSATVTQSWAWRWARPGLDVANSTVFSPDGSRVFATGVTTGATSGEDVFTVAYNATTGATLWTREYSSPGNADDRGWRVVVSPDGTRVFVVGSSPNINVSATANDYVTIAYDAASGQRLWLERFNPTGTKDFQAVAVAVSQDGSRLFVTGAAETNTVNNQEVRDMVTVAYNAATGGRLWSARFNGPHGDDAPSAIGVSPDGTHVFVTGEVNLASGDRWETICYGAADGTFTWYTGTSTGPGDVIGSATAMAVGTDGTVWVAGVVPYSTTMHFYEVRGYDSATGANTHEGFYGTNKLDYPTAIAVSGDGGSLYVTGEGDGDYATVAFPVTADWGLTRRWVARYDGPAHGFDHASSLALTPDGKKVIVTGWSTGTSGGLDWATLAYTASTGTLIWLRRNNGPGSGDDYGNALAISPDSSRVVVAGSTTGATTGDDWSVIAYRTG